MKNKMFHCLYDDQSAEDYAKLELYAISRLSD